LKILVTGGAGFIGSHIADAYIEQGHEVVIIDNLSTGNERNINAKAKFYHLDITTEKISEIFDKEKIDVINHLAAQINLRYSVENSLFDAQVNILGSINILQNCLKYKCRKIIFSSTGGAIYGQPKENELPVDENYPPDPQSPYGISKLTVENYLHFFQRDHNLPFTILRYSNVYGPRQDPAGEAGVISIFIENILKNKTSIVNGDGKQTRDFVFVDDVVRANLLALDGAENQVINISTAEQTSINEIYRLIMNSMNYSQEPIYGPEKKGEVCKISLSFAKAKKYLHWQPEVNLSHGISKTVSFFTKK
jgi:UDP-glucose 4-epimerase